MLAEDGEGGPGYSSPEAVVAAGLRVGSGVREIAVDVYGVARVESEWIPDGSMHAEVCWPVRGATDGTGPRRPGQR